MEYLKKYGLKEEEIEKIKEKYNDWIIKFITENEEFVTETIEYLYSENIKIIYYLMINNIQIFLETKIALREKIEGLKEQGLPRKKIQMELLGEK
jgi:hypothetical protein